MSSNSSVGSPEGAVSAELVERCQRGDRGAQRQLYEACRGGVDRLVLRMVGRADAGDVAQQVFLQALRRIGQFDGRARFETWLYRIAVNESLQHLRRRRRWKRGQSLETEPLDASPPHDEQVECKELVDRALARLEPELRSLFWLREVEGMSYREIALSLDIPEGTVGSRLNRVRQELQRHLKDLGWGP